MGYHQFCGDSFTIVFIAGPRNTIVASYRMVPPMDPMTSPVKVIWPDGHTCIIGPWPQAGRFGRARICCCQKQIRRMSVLQQDIHGGFFGGFRRAAADSHEPAGSGV